MAAPRNRGMTRRGSQFEVDPREVLVVAETMKALNVTLNTDRHLDHVTRAAFNTLEEQFSMTTHLAARNNPLAFHHVYEWEHIGEPGFGLWKLQMNGRGGERTISWTWRASKTTVPTTTTVTGEKKFIPFKGFDESKLNRIHIFVWKAPMMEYGATVEIRPELSERLVYPNPGLEGTRAGGPKTVTFSPHPHRVEVSDQEGSSTLGKFTGWFTAWFGGGEANAVLEGIMDKRRDKVFRESFERRISSHPTLKTKHKNFSFRPDAGVAADGKALARAIARDLEHDYIAAAAARKRMMGNDNDS